MTDREQFVLQTLRRIPMNVLERAAKEARKATGSMPHPDHYDQLNAEDVIDTAANIYYAALAARATGKGE